ncbi:hypothetical protein J7J13_01255 [bacterium]|nr:hypothetical protein [bacterium]
MAMCHGKQWGDSLLFVSVFWIEKTIGQKTELRCGLRAAPLPSSLIAFFKNAAMGTQRKEAALN